MSQDIVRHDNIYHAFSIVSDRLNGFLGRLAHSKRKRRVNLFFPILNIEVLVK